MRQEEFRLQSRCLHAFSLQEFGAALNGFQDRHFDRLNSQSLAGKPKSAIRGAWLTIMTTKSVARPMLGAPSSSPAWHGDLGRQRLTPPDPFATVSRT
jgi:hypothetical protein